MLVSANNAGAYDALKVFLIMNLKGRERNTGEFSTTTMLHVADRKNYLLY